MAKHTFTAGIAAACCLFITALPLDTSGATPLRFDPPKKKEQRPAARNEVITADRTTTRTTTFRS